MTELMQYRTARTRTEMRNGRHVQSVYASDIHYMSGGGFEQCDPTIKSAGQGWKLDTMPYMVSFPSFASGVLGFRDVRLESKDVEYQIANVGVQAVDGIIEPGQVVYPDAYGPGCDLVYCVRASGIAKLVRVQPDSAVTGPFQFDLELPASAKIKRRNGLDEYEVSPKRKKHTDTARLTVIESGGKETYFYPFKWRAGDQSGVLPVDIEYSKGKWSVTKAIPAAWDRSAPLEMDLTATGAPVIDGYMGQVSGSSFTTCRDAATGNSIGWGDASNTLYGKRGITTAYCFRGAFAWSNTVPVGATISAIDLSLTFVSGVSAVTSQWVQWTPSSYSSPASSDYRAGPSYPFKRTAWCDTRIAALVSGVDTRSLNAAAIAAFVASGTNGYGVMEYASDYLLASYTGGSSYGQVAYSENATPANRPVQTITYTLPAASFTQGALGQLASIKSLGVLAQ